ncbi:MAG: nitroreductase family protein [Dehalococcoidales bacterium]|nr:nitroreductase family protein [Dehalococcoidales bacterium]
MELTAAIQKRCSIRRFKDTPVEKEKITKILEAAQRAPSWGNTQPWRFLVITDKAKMAEVAQAAGGQPQAAGAPVLIVCCATIDDMTKKGHGEALRSLIPAGAMTEELVNIVLGSDIFAPYRRGDAYMAIKAGEQMMIAVAYMTLAAVDQGLATCWVGAITPKEIHKVLNLPDNIFVHSLLPVGYADEDPKPRPRKDLNKIVFWEKYS